LGILFVAGLTPNPGAKLAEFLPPLGILSVIERASEDTLDRVMFLPPVGILATIVDAINGVYYDGGKYYILVEFLPPLGILPINRFTPFAKLIIEVYVFLPPLGILLKQELPSLKIGELYAKFLPSLGILQLVPGQSVTLKWRGASFYPHWGFSGAVTGVFHMPYTSVRFYPLWGFSSAGGGD